MSGPNDPIPGTACFQLNPDIQAGEVAIADEGRSYRPDFTDSLKNELIDPDLDLSKSTLRYIAITGPLCGIQISDGVHECVWANTVDWNIIPTGKLFTLEQSADFMENNTESII